MERVPAASDVVVKVALPEASSVPVPMDAAPSRNVTVPVGTAELPGGPATVAIKVTDAPVAMLLADALSAVVVGTAATVTVTTGETDAANIEVPA